MTLTELISFSLFLIFIFGIMLFDLGIFDKRSHIPSLKESISWTIVWVSFAFGFYFLLLYKGDFLHGIKDKEQLYAVMSKYHEHLKIDALSFDDALSLYRKNLALEYISGYLIEYSLSADNIFVIILIFLSFGINQKYYKRVLLWGIVGAIIMRFIFIFLSSALIQNFYWILYVFGGFLIITGVRMFISRNKNEKIDTQKHPVVKFASRYFGIFPKLVGQRFYVIRNKKLLFTPLMLVLLVIEFSDVIFAIDSVPAVFSVTRDPFIVFFSNIFAILGLRSLFFLLSNIMSKFRYLNIGLSVLLVFVGCKMIFHEFLESNGFTTAHSLYVIIGILATSVIASLIVPLKKEISV
jgi:tellurite resistance protein TerC